MLTVLSQSQNSEDLNAISQYLNLNFGVSVPVSERASKVLSLQLLRINEERIPPLLNQV